MIERTLRRHSTVNSREETPLPGTFKAPAVAAARANSGTRISSPCLRSAFHLLSIVSPTTINVLIQGGSGDERPLIAETIHEMSDRRENAFIRVDCRALSSTRFEKELFSQQSGSNSQDQQRTCFERAFQGTLFLNDIECIPHSLQRRLLDVLRYREVPAASGNRPRRIDIRLITASGQNLSELVQRSGFDKELHNLLRVFPIDMAHFAEHENN